ncbi:MAG: glycosyltransferase [Clostridia bacterium]|nr:glycosyltransferase [Clostridia bacterium]
MRILMINSVCGIGSTGRICTDLAASFEKDGDTVKIAYGRGEVPEQHKKYAVRIGSDLDTKLHALNTRLTDRHGFCSKKATKRFLQWAESFDPELVWLHNIHGYYINVEMLFAWIKSRPHMQVRWTLHDCWAFTGHCSHFVFAGCDKWKTGCSSCPQKTKYPASFLLDHSKRNYLRKKTAFTGVPNMTLVTPSKWLADLVEKSFLQEYPTEVRYNTVDTSVFKPTPSDFRQRCGLEGKKIILGVCFNWGEKKGLPDFIKLGTMLDDSCAIVMVGVSEKQRKALPANILALARTNNPRELAEIYTAADVFFNPTYEDNYPTVNLEAQACGTPVITYRTDGAPETITDPRSIVVEQGDLDAACKCIRQMLNKVE